MPAYLPVRDQSGERPWAEGDAESCNLYIGDERYDAI